MFGGFEFEAEFGAGGRGEVCAGWVAAEDEGEGLDEIGLFGRAGGAGGPVGESVRGGGCGVGVRTEAADAEGRGGDAAAEGGARGAIEMGVAVVAVVVFVAEEVPVGVEDDFDGDFRRAHVGERGDVFEDAGGRGVFAVAGGEAFGAEAPVALRHLPGFGEFEEAFVVGEGGVEIVGGGVAGEGGGGWGGNGGMGLADDVGDGRGGVEDEGELAPVFLGIFEGGEGEAAVGAYGGAEFADGAGGGRGETNGDGVVFGEVADDAVGVFKAEVEIDADAGIAGDFAGGELN